MSTSSTAATRSEAAGEPPAVLSRPSVRRGGAGPPEHPPRAVCWAMWPWRSLTGRTRAASWVRCARSRVCSGRWRLRPPRGGCWSGSQKRIWRFCGRGGRRRGPRRGRRLGRSGRRRRHHPRRRLGGRDHRPPGPVRLASQFTGHRQSRAAPPRRLAIGLRRRIRFASHSVHFQKTTCPSL